MGEPIIRRIIKIIEEVKTARGKETDLSTRLNKSDEELTSKMNKIDLFTNIKDFDVLGNEMDETIKIQTAINSLTTGGIIIFPEGTFCYTNLTVNSNITLLGKGLNTIFKSDGVITCGSNTKIDSINFKTKTSKEGVYYSSLGVAVKFINATNCKFINCFGDGLNMIFTNVNGFECKGNTLIGGNWSGTRGGFQCDTGSKNGNVEGNTIHDCMGDGFCLQNTSYITLDKNESYSNGFTGFFTAYSNNLTIINNSAHDHTIYEGFDLNFSADTEIASVIRNSIIENNKIYDNYGNGMLISGSNLIIKKNIIYNNGMCGLNTARRSDGTDNSIVTGIIIEGNIVYNNNMNNNAADSGLTSNIKLSDVKNSSISNNIVYQNTGTCEFFIFVSTTGINVHDNVCSGSVSDIYPIKIIGTNIIIKDNTINSIVFPPILSGSTVVSFKNGWTNLSGEYKEATCTKDDFGIVSLSGAITSGTVALGTTVLTLPMGYRPSKTLIFNQSNNGAIKRLDLRNDGSLNIGEVFNLGYLNLNGITFQAEQ